MMDALQQARQLLSENWVGISVDLRVARVQLAISLFQAESLATIAAALGRMVPAQVAAQLLDTNYDAAILQSNYDAAEQRIAALEARVDALTTQVRGLGETVLGEWATGVPEQPTAQPQTCYPDEGVKGILDEIQRPCPRCGGLHGPQCPPANAEAYTPP
ncbi:MAG: hypothetical protein WC718_18510, partial [Phycisphaerales bacterium]